MPLFIAFSEFLANAMFFCYDERLYPNDLNLSCTSYSIELSKAYMAEEIFNCSQRFEPIGIETMAKLCGNN